MAYIKITLTGDKSFSGFLSIDKESPFALEDNAVYHLTKDGLHLFELHSVHVTSSGAPSPVMIYDKSSAEAPALSAGVRRYTATPMESLWYFQATASKNDVLEIVIESEEGNPSKDPEYSIIPMSEAAANQYLFQFEEIYRAQNEYAAKLEAEEQERKKSEEEERRKSTPRKSIPHIIWGWILVGLGVALPLSVVFAMLDVWVEGASFAEMVKVDEGILILPVIIALGAIAAVVGAILLINGMREKIR